MFLILSSEIIFHILCFSSLKVPFGIHMHSATSLYSTWRELEYFQSWVSSENYSACSSPVIDSSLSLSLQIFFFAQLHAFSPYTWADYYLAKGSECPYTDFWSSLHSALLSSALCPQIWLPFGLHDLFGFLPLVRRFSPETAPRLSWCYWRVCLVFSSLLRVVVLYCLLPETAIVSYNLFCLIFCIYNGSKGHFIGVSPSWIEVKVEIKPFAQSQTRKKSGKNPISRT